MSNCQGVNHNKSQYPQPQISYSCQSHRSQDTYFFSGLRRFPTTTPKTKTTSNATCRAASIHAHAPAMRHARGLTFEAWGSWGKEVKPYIRVEQTMCHKHNDAQIMITLSWYIPSPILDIHQNPKLCCLGEYIPIYDEQSLEHVGTS